MKSVTKQRSHLTGLEPQVALLPCIEIGLGPGDGCRSQALRCGRQWKRGSQQQAGKQLARSGLACMAQYKGSKRAIACKKRHSQSRQPHCSLPHLSCLDVELISEPWRCGKDDRQQKHALDRALGMAGLIIQQPMHNKAAVSSQAA